MKVRLMAEQREVYVFVQEKDALGWTSSFFKCSVAHPSFCAPPAEFFKQTIDCTSCVRQSQFISSAFVGGAADADRLRLTDRRLVDNAQPDERSTNPPRPLDAYFDGSVAMRGAI
jgi:hypothetical protein